MKIDTNAVDIAGKKIEVPLVHMSSDKAFRSLFFHSVFLFIAAFIYAKTGKVLVWAGIAYFGANTCFLLLLLLVILSVGNKKEGTKKEDLDKALKTEKKKEEQKKEQKNAPTIYKITQNLYKKKKITIIPSKVIIKKYNEYKDKFKLSKKIEKSFKEWVHKKVVQYQTTNEYKENMYRWSIKTLTKAEQEEIELFTKNGFIYYDKSNDLHRRALFKMFYNYFNAIMPREGSYYANPMDEYIFYDIGNTKINTVGLMVEDTESLMERKKAFNVYFMDQNILYDTDGDIALSFLLLLIYANCNTGKYLGLLSLRQMPFFPK